MIRKKLVKDMFDQLETANWLASQDFDSIRKLKEQRDLGAVEKVYAALAKAGILGTKEQ